jgi:lipopolysaccharide assembly outer membrane protein LptD (OstA)
MKTKIKVIVLGLFLASVLSSSAALDSEKIEMRAASVTLVDRTTVFKGSAVAIIGETRITAEQMIYDSNAGTLKCVGEAKLEKAGSIMIGNDLTIDLKSKHLSVRDAKITMVQK